MNLSELQNKLIAAARVHAPGDQVPYAFEKRVTALLAARMNADQLSVWVRGLWRAAISCVAITVLLGAWVLFSSGASAGATNLSQNFENTLLAAVDQSQTDQAQ